LGTEAPSHDGYELKRSIGLIQATAMVVGTIIGASIFVQPSEITRWVPSTGGVFWTWAICGILTFFGSLVCAEFASAFPQTGGVYVFLKEAYSPPVAFLWGWAMFWSVHSGIIAAIGVVFARYLGFFVPFGDLGIRGTAIGGILLLSAVNYVGVKHGSVLQTALTLGKVLAILVIITLAFVLVPPSSNPSLHHAAAVVSDSIPLTNFAQALVAGLFAFGGWHMITYAAGETFNPHKTIPRALMIGTVVVTACYLSLNAAYLHVLPLETVITSKRVAADAAEALIGKGGAAAISALVIFSAFGALSGIILAGPRVYFSMARDGLVFRWIGAIHPRFQTPHRAIVLQALWSSALVATGTYRALFTRVIYTEWIFFGLLAIGLILLRRRPGYNPSYRTWGYPVIPVLFVISAALIVLNQVASAPLENSFGLLLVGLGLPVYYFWFRKPYQKGEPANVHH
jgi:APA family basic amino acid/polyamine antiporter